MSYPKTFTHRHDHHSKVVVANAEQEADLPHEYLPAVTHASGKSTSAADHAADVMLSPEYAKLTADIEALNKARAEHAEAVQKLADERAELTAGYKASMAKLEAERAAWETEKAGAAPDPVRKAHDEADARALVKRGRPAKD